MTKQTHAKTPPFTKICLYITNTYNVYCTTQKIPKNKPKSHQPTAAQSRSFFKLASFALLKNATSSPPVEYHENNQTQLHYVIHAIKKTSVRLLWTDASILQIGKSGY